MMDKIWMLKFTSAMSVPGSEVNLYFDNEEAARSYFDTYAGLLGQKCGEIVHTMRANDMYGSHVLRPDFYPRCTLMEMSAMERTFKDIDDSWKKFKERVGGNTQVGFKIPEEGRKDEN
jgi:hypothetical protein